ncbi:nucleoside triphosphate pyrophosphohydrolase [Verrucomicrobiota bacterium]
MDRLLHVVDRLRGENGCPWDREQTLHTLKQYLIEECYEVIDALDTGSVEDHREELGDVLLHVALQARIRREEGEFSFNDVANEIADKLIRRHPHVFGDVEVSGSSQVLQNWEAIKVKEKKEPSVLHGVPRHLPSLQKAQRVQSRVSRVGFDWSGAEDVLAKVDEELAETRAAISGGDEREVMEEVGDLLFAVVNLSRFQKINAEEALRATVAKFTRRFKEVERRLRDEGRKIEDSSLDEMEVHWQAAKGDEARASSSDSGSGG